MAEKSSCMTDALDTQEANKDTLCSTENTNVPNEVSKKPAESAPVKAGSLLDAAQYVEAVMGSQQITAVLRTPTAAASSRKRHLSLPAVGESEVKKIRSDMSNEGDSTNGSERTLRNVVRARRNLLGKKCDSSEKEIAGNNSNPDESKGLCDTEKILNAMEKFRCGLESKIDEMNRSSNEKFESMRNEIEKIRNDFNGRMEGLAKKVESKVTKSLDKELDSKVKTIKSGFDKELQKVKSSNEKVMKSMKRIEETILPTFKEEAGDEIDELNRRIKNLEEKVTTSGQSKAASTENDEFKRSIVIRNLEERENENVKDRVNSLIYNGLKIDTITVESANRKQSRSDSRAGIIIAVCKSLKDKETIMKRKSDLKNSRRYEKVYIEHNLPMEQRRLNSNLRTIVNTIGNDRLHLRGSRVLQADGERRDNMNTYAYKRPTRSYGETQTDRNYYKDNRDSTYDRDYTSRNDSDHSYHRSHSNNSYSSRPESAYRSRNRR